MNKALIVGGNSGIGLSVCLNLLSRDYEAIHIIGKEEPRIEDIPDHMISSFKNKVSFHKLNLVGENFSILDSISDINTLIISAGFGRVALLEDLTEEEVSNILKVNLEANIRIIKHYYDRICGDTNFYTAVMVSICGRVVSPFFSVYGATKAGLRFFIENANSELIANKRRNRILEVSPGSIKGTNFNGNGNNLSEISEITEEMMQKMFNREMLYIPQYDDVYKNVIAKYNNNPIGFGQESFQYKLNSGRTIKNPQVVIGYLSGTFDLFHIGHLNLLRRAKEQCDYLIVSVHDSGAWKGKDTFIPYEERKEIVSQIKYVDKVVEDYIEDSDAWEIYHYDKLFVGSDYKGTERFNKYEKDLKGKAEIVYFPYTPGTSSTQLRSAISNACSTTKKRVDQPHK